MAYDRVGDMAPLIDRTTIDPSNAWRARAAANAAAAPPCDCAGRLGLIELCGSFALLRVPAPCQRARRRSGALDGIDHRLAIARISPRIQGFETVRMAAAANLSTSLSILIHNTQHRAADRLLRRGQQVWQYAKGTPDVH